VTVNHEHFVYWEGGAFLKGKKRKGRWSKGPGAGVDLPGKWGKDGLVKQ